MIELAGIAGLAMLLGCFVPRHLLPRKMPHDSVLHIAAFALISLPLCQFSSSNTSLLLICIGIWTVGFVIECIQHFIPQRRFGVDDLLYNAAGIALVALPCAWIRF